MKKIGSLSELKQRKSLKFPIKQGKWESEGFLIWFEGKPYAYKNECQHLHVTLDMDDNDFFAIDGTLLCCKTHGALYQADTGYCVGGPCAGETLKKLKIEMKGDAIYLAE